MRSAGWDFTLGTRISSSGSGITGPYVQGQGLSVRRTRGLLIGDLVLAQPTTFRGEAAGHLVRGRLGIKTAVGTVGVAISDFERPVGGYSTLPPITDPTLDPDSLEALERQRRLTPGSVSTRVQGVGLEAELQPTDAHQLVLRAGFLRLANAAGEEVGAPTVEAQYAFTSRSATLRMRWQQMPPQCRVSISPARNSPRAAACAW